MVVSLEPGLAPGLEEVHGGGHDLARATVGVAALQMVRIEQHDKTPGAIKRVSETDAADGTPLTGDLGLIGWLPAKIRIVPAIASVK
ncbi:hypothetical protein NJB14192_49620 [Mycobacterium montefiorense]|nr:hypothetical protein NJB14192_49620 [Mycobacterium montefiorense]GKU72308.1 hypothetical protein NJB18185_20840 [Mycobacterium montefiorense]